MKNHGGVVELMDTSTYIDIATTWLDNCRAVVFRVRLPAVVMARTMTQFLVTIIFIWIVDIGVMVKPW